MLNIWFGYVGGRGTNIAPRWDTAASVVPVASEATYSRGGLPPYFPSIIMLPSMSLSEP
jgi:hypothetical protein